MAKKKIRLVFFGVPSFSLYFLLFAYSTEILRWSTRTDGFYFLLPVAIALVFSFVHGAFTGYFWAAFGIEGKTSAKANARSGPAQTHARRGAR